MASRVGAPDDARITTGTFEDTLAFVTFSAMPDVTAKMARVLLSGGLDSTACLAFYLKAGFTTTALYIDYGHPSAALEQIAATRIAAHYGITLATIKCTGLAPVADGEIYGRNAFLVFTAILGSRSEPGLLALGIHANTGYYDCSPIFVHQIQTMLDHYTDGNVVLSTPFLDWTKRDIWDFCHVVGVPIHLTYSCERGAHQPCGVCRTCNDLEALHAGSAVHT